MMFVIGIATSTGELAPSVSAGIIPRVYLQDARDVAALVSSGRVTSRSHSGGVGGRSSVVASAPASSVGGASLFELLQAVHGTARPSEARRSPENGEKPRKCMATPYHEV